MENHSITQDAVIIGNSTRAISQRALEYTRKSSTLFPIPSPMETSPKITFSGPGGNPPISGGVTFPYDTSNATLLGMLPSHVQQYGSQYWKNAINGTWTVTPYAVEFDHWGTDFCLIYRKNSAAPESFWLFVDDRPSTAVPFPVSGVVGSAGSLYYLKVSFATVAFRRIRIFCALADFGGILTHVEDSVSPSRTPLPRLGWIGDSWGEGTSQLSNGMLPIPQLVALMIGCAPVLNASQGGTGWVSSGGDFKAPFGDLSRIGPMLAAAPDILVLQGSINDTGSNAAVISRSVTTTIDRLTVALPTTRIFAVGVQMLAGSTPTPSLENNEAFFTGVAAARAAANITCIDPIAEGWISGSGNAGTPAGNGNADRYIGADGVHPTDAGAEYWASRIAAYVAANY